MSLQDFQILSRLGEGTYSSVWQAKRISDGEIYAIKKVKMGSLSEKEKMNSLNEVRLLASIASPFIIEFKEVFFEDSQTLCVVMEYAGGGDIHQAITKHQKERMFFKEKDIWRYAVQMILGLKTLHDRKILHRDLKCANVFLSKDGEIAKLGDLNVSKVAKHSLVYTQTGTPYYASPEVWRDEPYDMKSDIWSLGCVIYEMCALKPPFRANDMPGLFKKVQKGAFDKIPSQYSADLNTLISFCLQVTTSKRLSCDQLLEHPVVQKNGVEVLQGAEEIDNSTALLNTIRLPKNVKNLRSLRLKLPKANYQKHTKSADFNAYKIQINGLETLVEHQGSTDIDRESKDLTTKSSAKRSPSHEYLLNIPEQGSKKAPNLSPRLTPTQSQDQSLKQSPRSESHKEYLVRMQKEYADGRGSKLAEIPNINNNNKQIPRENKRVDIDLRARRVKKGLELNGAEGRSIGLVKQVKAELDHIYLKQKSVESKELDPKRLYAMRKSVEEAHEIGLDISAGSRGSGHLNKKSLEKARIEAMDRRIQNLIQKYQQELGAVEKRREGLTNRASPDLKEKRPSKDVVDRMKLVQESKPQPPKIYLFEKHTSSPLKREYRLSEDQNQKKYEELKKSYDPVSAEQLKILQEKGQAKASQKPTWWG